MVKLRSVVQNSIFGNVTVFLNLLIIREEKTKERKRFGNVILKFIIISVNS